MSTLFAERNVATVGTTGLSDGGGLTSGTPTGTVGEQASSIDPSRAGVDFGQTGGDIARSEGGLEQEMATEGATEAETTVANTGARVQTGKIGESSDIPDSMDQTTAGKVASKIKARRSRVLDCYNKELAKDPGLSGKLVVYFDVYDGKTEGVDVTGMTGSLQSCVSRQVKGWSFDGVEEAEGIELTYNLQPSN